LQEIETSQSSSSLDVTLQTNPPFKFCPLERLTATKTRDNMPNRNITSTAMNKQALRVIYQHFVFIRRKVKEDVVPTIMDANTEKARRLGNDDATTAKNGVCG
jgi:hypothetical protein